MSAKRKSARKAPKARPARRRRKGRIISSPPLGEQELKRLRPLWASAEHEGRATAARAAGAPPPPPPEPADDMDIAVGTEMHASRHDKWRALAVLLDTDVLAAIDEIGRITCSSRDVVVNVLLASVIVAGKQLKSA